MAGLRYSFRVNPTVASGTTATLMQLVAPANQRVRIESIEVDGRSVSSSDVPVDIRVITQTSAGTFGGSATAQKNPANDAGTVQTACNTAPSGEPTLASAPLDCFLVPPQSGRLRQYPPGRDMYIVEGTKVGIVATNNGSNNQVLNLTVFLEE